MKRAATWEFFEIKEISSDIFGVLLEKMDIPSRFHFSATCVKFYVLLFQKMTTLNELATCLNEEIIERFPNLTSINLSSTYRITDKSLSLLTRLRELRIDETEQFTTTSLKCLTNLTSLQMEAKNIDFNVIAMMKQLKVLTLNDTRYDKIDEYYYRVNGQLSQVSSLTSLCLSNVYFIQDQHIKPLTHLKILKIQYDTRITDDCLRSLTQLETLNLVRTKTIQGDSFRELNQLTRLSTFFSFGNNYHQSGMNYGNISFLTKLKVLRIRGNIDIDLKPFTDLTYLDISWNNEVKSDSLTILNNLSRLNYIQSDMTFHVLAKLTNLTYLGSRDQYGCVHSAKILKLLNDSKDLLPNLKIINGSYRENYLLDFFRKKDSSSPRNCKEKK